ncbi:hypothetical protein C8R47DRAFT_1123386 [Mycena vitilis]|nr:hypothetical protein C8R47DRAFT_1123386 [Mycena vitilis]
MFAISTPLHRRSIKPRWISRHVAIGPRSSLDAEDSDSLALISRFLFLPLHSCFFFTFFNMLTPCSRRPPAIKYPFSLSHMYVDCSRPPNLVSISLPFALNVDDSFAFEELFHAEKALQRAPAQTFLSLTPRLLQVPNLSPYLERKNCRCTC